MEELFKIFLYQSEEYIKALELRHRILRKPLNLEFTEEELKKDVADIHCGLFNNQEIIACLTLTKAGENKMKMRQVAVDEKYQQKGFGRKLSEEAEKFAKINGCTIMFCNARKVAVPFYQKLGYKIISDEFTEVNIPHYTMEKRL